MENSSHALRRDSMAQCVKQGLQQQILSGHLVPGTRLRELQIAREFDTSQGPVREALRQLEALDLITTEPYKGSHVREVSPEEIREAYAIRAMLEELAGPLAALHMKGDVAALRLMATEIQKVARRKDVVAYGMQDLAFHRAIVEAAKSRVLLRTWDSLSFEVHIQLWLTRGRVNLSVVQNDHWKILDALERGDGKRAGRLLHAHAALHAEESLLHRKQTL